MLRKELWMVVVIMLAITTWLYRVPVAHQVMTTPVTEPIRNTIQYTPKLSSGGQPSEVQLIGLKEQGYEVIINLLPKAASGRLENEDKISVSHQLEYFNIPVSYNEPTIESYKEFEAVMMQLEGKKIFVHCQINLRASSFLFIYLVNNKEYDQDTLGDLIESVWTPNDIWVEFITQELERSQNELQLMW